MANPIVTTSTAGFYSTYIIRKLIPGLKAELLFQDYAEPARVPARQGHVVARWNVPVMRVGSVTPLVEGTLVAVANILTVTNVETTIEDFGEWCYIEDLANETAISESLDAYKDIVQYAAASSLDTLHYNTCVDNFTSFLHSGDTATAGVTLATTNTMTAQDLPVIAAHFHAGNTKGFDSLSGDFALFIHPNTEKDLVTHVTTAALSWSEMNKYVPAGFEQLINTHRFVGRMQGVSVLRTTIIGTLTEDVAAYRCVALARWGLGTLGLGTTGPKAPEIKFKSPGKSSTNDPLDQLHTLGWKFRNARAVLQQPTGLIFYAATGA